MNRIGVDGCRQRREEIVGWLKEEWSRLGVKDKLAVAVRAVWAGMASPTDPVGWLVDEAVRRAEGTKRGGGP